MLATQSTLQLSASSTSCTHTAAQYKEREVRRVIVAIAAPCFASGASTSRPLGALELWTSWTVRTVEMWAPSSVAALALADSSHIGALVSD